MTGATPCPRRGQNYFAPALYTLPRYARGVRGRERGWPGRLDFALRQRPRRASPRDRRAVTRAAGGRRGCALHYRPCGVAPPKRWRYRRAPATVPVLRRTAPRETIRGHRTGSAPARRSEHSAPIQRSRRHQEGKAASRPARSRCPGCDRHGGLAHDRAQISAARHRRPQIAAPTHRPRRSQESRRARCAARRSYCANTHTAPTPSYYANTKSCHEFKACSAQNGDAELVLQLRII
jgi:hypothetical protein